MSPATEDVGGSGGPVSGINLSTRMATVWRRGKTKVNHILGNTPPETREACEMPYLMRPFPSQFPYDIVEMVIAYLTRYPSTLKACSLTCRSWYTVAVPHLYRTVTLTGDRPEIGRSRLEPLSKLHGLGLISSVREIRVKEGPVWNSWFVPQAFGPLDLRYFSALENIHTLRVEHMQIDQFIRSIGHYFKHFSPTLRSIGLYDPWCTPRQLSHFLTFFPNLDDTEIMISDTYGPSTTTPDTERVPFPVQKPRGRLALYYFTWAETWTHMITLCGGLQFRHLDLRGVVSCAPLLFEACAETLETLRIDARENTVGDLSSPSPKFNLSGLKALRSLQVVTWAGRRLCGDHRNTIVAGVFSTITSPVFSELVIIIPDHLLTYLAQEVRFFETLRKMNEVRPFKLVFFLVDLDNDQGGRKRRSASLPLKSEELWRGWREAMDSEAARKSLPDFLDPPPTARIVQSRTFDWDLTFQPN